MKPTRALWRILAVFVVLLVLAGAAAFAWRKPLRSDGAEIPVSPVKRGNLEPKVYTSAEIRATRSAMLTAPPVGGGSLQITQLVDTGVRVKAGEVVVEFDPSEQQYNLEQSRSNLEQAEQEIVKAKADAAVQAAQDKVALLKAQFGVRRAELDVRKNELVSSIDAKKNLLALEEAKRALAQLEQDIKSHAFSNQAGIAVSEEKRNKARLAMQAAQQNIANMRVRSPLNGLMMVQPNMDSSGGFFFGGMSLPDYREGDQVRPGNMVARVIDTDELELVGQVSESERANVKVGQPVDTRADALPEEVFRGKVKTVANVATSANFWEANTSRKFDVAVQLDKVDPRLLPGFTAQMTILGQQTSGVLSIPRQALFDVDGKRIVYLKTGNHFEPREVKVRYQTESRTAIEGLAEGAEVALVNPGARSEKTDKAAGPAGPALGGGRP
jgi:HlyD family secretion protein